jgi:hypothetical protein
LRKPISASDTYIPEAYKEKEYQNSFFDEVKRLGVSNMQLIGAKDLNKLIRIEGGEMYMNSLYPYWKQKAAMDNAIFKEGLQLQKYGYKIISEVEEISSKTVKALDKVKNLSNEVKKTEYRLAIENALDGKLLNSEFQSTFFVVGLLFEHGFSKQQIRIIANEPKELDAYKDRITQPLPLLEKAIYQDFKIGQFYTCVDAKSKVTNAITNSPQSTVRVNSNHYFKILNRYYYIKRKSAKKGLEILAKREIPRTELCLNY